MVAWLLQSIKSTFLKNTSKGCLIFFFVKTKQWFHEFFANFRALLWKLSHRQTRNWSNQRSEWKWIKERKKEEKRKTVACITSAIIAMSMMRFWEVVTWETHWRHRSRTRLTNSSSKKKNSIVLWISDYLQSQWTPFSHMVPLIVGDVREALDSYYLIIIILY